MSIQSKKLNSLKLLRSNRGAGLIDVMFTVFLVSVAGAIFSATMPAAIKCTRQGQEYSVATSIAQRKMEQIRAINYESLGSSLLISAGIIDTSSSAGNCTFTQADGLAEILPTGEGTITIADENAALKRITVNISWTSPSSPQNRSVQLTTLVADKRPQAL